MSDTFTTTLELPKSVTRKFGGELFTLPLDKVPAVSLEYVLIRGLRCINDSVNSAKNLLDDNAKKRWARSDTQAYVDEFLDGSIAEKSSRREGTSVLSDVEKEAIRLATAYILQKLGGLKWAEAAAHEKGKRYFKVSEAGNVSQQVNEIVAFIDAYDAAAAEGKGFRARAEIIVGARGDDSDVEVDI